MLGAGALAAVALAGFVARQRTADPRFTAATSTITVLFFALFGFLFLSTQYLQFVLGYSPSAAGVRVLAVAVTVGTSTGYGRLGLALLLMGAGMGLAGAPATESIMSSLPPERANIGSAVNDTTRELGGALGVAIVGSIMSSLYGAQLSNALPDDVPAPVAAAAREAFVHAMSRASIVVAAVAALGAFIAWRYLPARGIEQRAQSIDARFPVPDAR